MVRTCKLISKGPRAQDNNHEIETLRGRELPPAVVPLVRDRKMALKWGSHRRRRSLLFNIMLEMLGYYTQKLQLGAYFYEPSSGFINGDPLCMCPGPAPMLSNLMNCCSTGGCTQECLSQRTVALNLNTHTNQPPRVRVSNELLFRRRRFPNLVVTQDPVFRHQVFAFGGETRLPVLVGFGWKFFATSDRTNPRDLVVQHVRAPPR